MALLGVPVGCVMPYVGTSAPSGYLLCDGSFVSQTTYADLFAIAGHAYNGGTDPGDNTFKLPDLRQRFPLGKATSGTGSTLGGTGGTIDHTHDAHTILPTFMVGGGMSGVTAPTTHSAQNPPFQVFNFVVKALADPSTDNSTVEVVAGVLRVKDLGVSTAKLAAQAVTLPKLERRTSGALLIGQGAAADVAEAVPAGDVTIGTTGVTAIGALKVTTGMIAANAVTAAKVAADVATQAELDTVASDLAAHDALGVSAAHGTVTAGDIAGGAVTAVKLAADVAGAGLVLNGVSNALDINPDGSTLEISVDALRVKDAGITAAKLASGAAASNVGSLSGDLTGTLPSPTVANSAITAAKVAAQAITIPKLERRTSGALLIGQGAGADVAEAVPAGDVTISTAGVTAIGSAKVVAGMLASGAAATNVGSLSGDLTGTLPSPSVANGAISSAKMAAGAAATNVGSLGGDLTGTLPSPTIAADAVGAAEIDLKDITGVGVIPSVAEFVRQVAKVAFSFDASQISGPANLQMRLYQDDTLADMAGFTKFAINAASTTIQVFENDVSVLGPVALNDASVSNPSTGIYQLAYAPNREPTRIEVSINATVSDTNIVAAPSTVTALIQATGPAITSLFYPTDPVIGKPGRGAFGGATP